MLIDFLNTHAERIVLLVVIVLAIFSLMVFIGAIYSRWRLNLREKREKQIRDKLSNLVIRYVSGDLKFEELKSKLSTETDYSILMQLTNELDKALEGEEEKRLKRLLNLPPIRSFFVDRFETNDPLEQAKACLYFSRQSKIKKSILPKLLAHTSSKYPMLAYSACMAVVIHGSADQIEKAIHNLLINEGISDQALNDIFKEFQAQSSEDSKVESQLLMDFIDDKSYSDKRTSLLIRTLGELHFYESAGLLLKEFLNLDESHYSPEIACALIDVLSGFGMDEILEDLHTVYSVSENREVRESAARALGAFTDPVSKPILKWMMLDPDFYVRFYAAKSLSNYPDIQLGELNLPGSDSEDYRELLGEIESSKELGY
ncbi:HEAT repeat domain-containing protein [Rhodohalobacter barkolensis]|uniref:HEAT repeat domain-containing protein n=1 Tax=Rhodohalobacter barkolensis TaxID=2053187 RepID=A0A2N0VH49_9BACT|nr:HEAT repeat domain-containing protein [Rhodohalobacter barkolensis]PKD43509.1 hypothetical protein CWD77_08030 [Rhodohalobacter barkolensis]